MLNKLCLISKYYEDLDSHCQLHLITKLKMIDCFLNKIFHIVIDSDVVSNMEFSCFVESACKRLRTLSIALMSFLKTV